MQREIILSRVQQMINVVWFKRDLRVHDNEALVRAAKTGRVLPLYIYEPSLWRQEEMSCRQHDFLKASLEELNGALHELGCKLIIKNGDAIDILRDLHVRYGINHVYSHQETWNGWTYRRDIKVARWLKSHDIRWFEVNQNGVIRGLKDRNGWAKKWQTQMATSQFLAPKKIESISEPSDAIEVHPNRSDKNNKTQILLKGGRKEGLGLLSSFLNNRGEHYTKKMSSPLTAYDSCSLLSAHLAFGTLSMTEVFQAAENRKLEIQTLKKSDRSKWPSTLNSFLGRLRWHCHFIQKLEDEPRIEFENMHSAYNGLRCDTFNEDHFVAWKTGNTGYPMIDACMRALMQTGWLNFRMRAMLVSFPSYHLWLHWRRPAIYLGSLFVDFEPGIHFSQMQMQSGTTGINSIRIYNPVKQSYDHDPDGVFIRKWVPELAHLNNTEIHEPWRVNINTSYPAQIIEEQVARKKAADRVYGLRQNNTHHNLKSQEIARKHGSRKSGLRNLQFNKQKKQPLLDPNQLKLPF